LAMTTGESGERDPPVSADLVEYLVVVVPEVDALSSVAEALAGLVQTGAIRILDLVVLVCDHDGAVVVREGTTVPSMAALGDARTESGGLLSNQDIELASLPLEPGTAGVVVVTEDRWAKPLSAAARLAGGQIVAGDRIPQSRVEAALADRQDQKGRG
jgi:hypothetical protein